METAGHFGVIDLTALQQAVTEVYRNFMVTQVNESCIRMAVMTGEFPWHRHPDSDELFLVLEGELIIDFAERDSVVLPPNAVFTIPAGVVHRTRALDRTVILCFEHLKATEEQEYVQR